MIRLIGVHPNTVAFLDTLAWCEGTSTCKNTLDDGYDIEVGGNRFSDYSEHPFLNREPFRVNKHLESTAAGRYQFLVKDYRHYQKLLRYDDFSPEFQDAWAIQLLKETRALHHVKRGELREAIDACNRIWASLPGSPYGQPTKEFYMVRNKWVEFGGYTV